MTLYILFPTLLIISPLATVPQGWSGCRPLASVLKADSERAAAHLARCCTPLTLQTHTAEPPPPHTTQTHTELERLHADRIAAMKKEAERRAELERKGHGTYEEVTEGEFLEVTTETENVVCHFYHRDFERCKILDKHLGALAKKHLETRFIKLSAPVRACLAGVIACSGSQPAAAARGPGRGR